MNDDENSADAFASLREFIDSPKLFTRFTIRRVRNGGEHGPMRTYGHELDSNSPCEETRRIIRVYAQTLAISQNRSVVRVNFPERMPHIAKLYKRGLLEKF